MSLSTEVLGSANSLVCAVRCAAVWLACIDRDLDEAERRDIAEALPDRLGEVALQRLQELIENAAAAEAYTNLGEVFAYIRQRMADQSKDAFIELMVGVAAADKRISIGERHGLLFLADLVDRQAHMKAAFAEATGLDWEDPADLSDPTFWDRLDAARARKQQQQDGQRSEQRQSDDRRDGWQRHGHNGNDAARIAALATLGLVGDPTQDEIRAAYRRLAALHHPDKYGALDAEAVAHATKTFQRIQAAYAVLRS
jgi:uncharacterized tellurite resistance protein B-like protein